MRNLSASTRMRATLTMLESTAAGAGRAMACPFGSSAEFEDAVIRERRKAGAYSRRRRLYRLLAATARGLPLSALLRVI
jgi:DNA invertase Pin-like site-specific DNA recombinase